MRGRGVPTVRPRTSGAHEGARGGEGEAAQRTAFFSAFKAVRQQDLRNGQIMLAPTASLPGPAAQCGVRVSTDATRQSVAASWRLGCRVLWELGGDAEFSLQAMPPNPLPGTRRLTCEQLHAMREGLARAGGQPSLIRRACAFSPRTRLLRAVDPRIHEARSPRDEHRGAASCWARRILVLGTCAMHRWMRAVAIMM